MTRLVKNPDEIIWEDVKMVHYEVMEPCRTLWMGIYLNNGQIYHLNIGGDNLWVNYSNESDLGPVEELSHGHVRTDLDAL